MNEFIEIDFISITQPIGTFYIGNIDWIHLINISESDTREIKQEDEKSNSFDSYLGIQRKRNPNRIKDIASYVQTIDATFPTSIILHIESSYEFIDGIRTTELTEEYIDQNLHKIEVVRNIEIDQKRKKLKIRLDDKVAKILDGQHRIEGLKKGFEEYSKSQTFELNVTIFVDADIDDQAQIFSVINKAQTKVNKSLVYDLYDYARFQSPQKSAHDIVRLLNKMASSPFYKKIKILGTAENKETETIAQATFVELIIKFISKKPNQDRDALKRQSLFNQHPLKKIDDLKQKRELIFRNLFIDNQNEKIMKTIWNFFELVSEKWPDSWKRNDIENNILNKSTGIIALMRFLRYVVNSIGVYDDAISKEQFEPYFSKIILADQTFSKEIYIPGSTGQSTLLKKLLKMTQLTS